MPVAESLLVEGIWRMYWLIGLRCIFAGPSENNILPAWVFLFELRDIVGSAMDNNPVQLIY